MNYTFYKSLVKIRQNFMASYGHLFKGDLGGEIEMKALKEIKAQGKVEIISTKGRGKSTGISVYGILQANAGKFISDTTLEYALGRTHQYINQSARNLAKTNPFIKRVKLTDHLGQLPQGRWYNVYLSEGKTLDDLLKAVVYLDLSE